MNKVIILMICIILLAGCQSAQPKENFGLLDWKYADLRLLDPSDADQPNQDLIALFSRENSQYFQMRIDFLDLGDAFSQDIYIPIDAYPGGLRQITTNEMENIDVDVNWDYLIKLSSSGSVEIINSHLGVVNGTALFIIRDRIQDCIILSVKRNSLPINLAKTHFQVIVTQPNQTKVLDKSAIFSLDTPSPARVKVLFAFWNTFNSATPATTLRSWAGAHSGPMRNRHGLKYLLDATAQNKSTLLLFDLLHPDALSALDYIGALPGIQNMATQGYLVLPKYEEIDNENVTLDKYSDFVLLLNGLLFVVDDNYGFGVNDYAQSFDNNCPITAFADHASSGLSFSLNCKRLFISTAFLPSIPPLILGGDFSSSILGDPSIISEVLNYINSHPWIQIITRDDLYINNNIRLLIPLAYSATQLATKTQPIIAASSLSSSGIESQVKASLDQAPNNLITKLARQVYDTLISTTSDNASAIRSNYLGQLGEMIAASEWSVAPESISTCSEDLDYDGTNECILANNKIFAVIEPIGGYIPFVFTSDQSGVHQIIGPTWQFLVGLGDPSTWDPSMGVRSDPDQILGALADRFYKWNSYNVEIGENEMVLSNSDMSMRKRLIISSDKMHIDIRDLSPSSLSFSIPLVLDPWIRYTTGWGDQYSSTQYPHEFLWGIDSHISVKIISTNRINGYPFNATRFALKSPEDPNFDYSPGHYLPYPMTLVRIDSSPSFTIDLVVNP
jgi:hypothetical protein